MFSKQLKESSGNRIQVKSVKRKGHKTMRTNLMTLISGVLITLVIGTSSVCAARQKADPQT